MNTTRRSNFSAALRTTVLLAGLTGLLVVIGALIGGPETALMFLFIALAMNLGTYFFSDKIALRMSGAQPMSEEQAPQIYPMDRELTSHAKMPMPAHSGLASRPRASARDPSGITCMCPRTRCPPALRTERKTRSRARPVAVCETE